MKIKYIVHFCVFILLFFLGVKNVFWGVHGIEKFWQEKHEVEMQKHKISRLEKKIFDLEKKIKLWQEDDFELEKMAREELLMGYENEKVYLLR